MNPPFSHTIGFLRKQAQLTNKQLATLANVPESLIAGLQSGKRRIGELQARKLGTALKLTDQEMELFVLQAIDTCSEKLLRRAQGFPAELSNLLICQLLHSGITADSLLSYSVAGSGHQKDVTLWLTTGGKALLRTKLDFP